MAIPPPNGDRVIFPAINLTDCIISDYEQPKPKTPKVQYSGCQIFEDYEQKDPEEQKKIRFYCEVLQNPDFLANQQDFLRKWAQRVEALGQTNFPPHEIDVLNRLKKIYENSSFG